MNKVRRQGLGCLLVLVCRVSSDDGMGEMQETRKPNGQM